MINRIEVLTEFANEAHERKETLFYVRIPGNIKPIERGKKYEDIIDIELKKAGIGEVAGGGSQLGENDTIIYCGIDVIVKDRNKGLKLLKSILIKLNLPDDSVIEEFLPNWVEHKIK